MGFLKATKFRGEESQARVSAEQNKGACVFDKRLDLVFASILTLHSGLAVARNSQVGFGTRVRAALRVPGDKRKQRKAKVDTIPVPYQCPFSNRDELTYFLSADERRARAAQGSHIESKGSLEV